MKNILINTSNLHVGGGVQVAVSFIDELSKSSYNLKKIDLWISTEVFENLIIINTNLSSFKSFKVINFKGIESFFSPFLFFNFLFIQRTVFTLFGPFYVLIKPSNHIMGFALPSLIYPETALSLLPNYFNKLKFILKRYIQFYFFSKVDCLVVELEHVKTELQKYKLFKKLPIYVVYNCFSNVFLTPEKWEYLFFPLTKKIKIGYLGRNYNHKNLNILPEVYTILKIKYNLNIEFYVTLTSIEWESTTTHFKKCITNIGNLNVSQCPTYYSKLDGVIFPSLLECFSVTPLEALIMGKPIFLADRHFNYDVIKNHGYYFDPLNPNNIADVIYNYFINKHNVNMEIESTKSYALNFSNAQNRMKEYIKILNY
jgi:hypothetical protein